MRNCILFAPLAALDYFFAYVAYRNENVHNMWFSLFCGVVLTLALIAQFLRWRETRRQLFNLKVMRCLRGSVLDGRELRETVSDFGFKTSGPAFYQRIARMEEDGLVSAQTIEGKRYYTATPKGENIWRDQ